jgi:hypothetical protein
MRQREWEASFKLVAVIEVSGPAERVRCLIGTWPPANKVVRVETYRGDELVHEEEFGFGPTLALAELIDGLEEQLRNDARATGSRVEVFAIPPPFGRAQFEAVLAARPAGGES